MTSILITVLLISAIALVLSLFLTLADKYIADYGEVDLYINDDEPIRLEGGSSLLKSLSEEKIFIPSACGGKGTCGYCKLKVLEGGGPVLATEMPWLSKEELENNYRLSCQVKVKNDMKIEIPEELFNVKEYKAKLISMVDVTDRIKHLRFELEDGQHIDFKPGQFIQLKAPVYEGSDEEVYRAYSIASSALDKGHLELFIGYTGGICTSYVHKHLKVGDTVEFNGPYGDFYYQDGDSDMLLVAAGTGMAPIVSILHHMRDNNIQRKAQYFFGARTPDDLFMLDFFKEMEEELYDFKFLPTLSRTTDEMNWQGDKGRVNNSVEKYVDPEGNYSAYLCGNPKMIESMIESLVKVNVDRDKIYYDEF